MSVRKVIFRVDSGRHIGIGHLMRCLTLAEGLSTVGIEVSFITKNHVGHRSELIPKKFEVHLLEGGIKYPLSEIQKNDYSSWLGESWDNDLDRVNLLVEKLEIDLLVIDHYSIDWRYECKVKCRKVFVIDDLMNREHYCDYLLDQNLSANLNQYKKLSKKPNALLLIGVRYALLRQEFKNLRKSITLQSFQNPIRKILIFFGGMDDNGNTFKMLNSLTPDLLQEFSFRVILHDKHEDYLKVKKITDSLKKADLISQSTNMAEDMCWSDLFIGASGTTSWERASLGVASAIVSVADNQLLVCKSLMEKKSIHYLGKDFEVDSSVWNDFFKRIIPKTTYWSELRENSFLLVDAEGVERVVSAIEGMEAC